MKLAKLCFFVDFDCLLLSRLYNEDGAGDGDMPESVYFAPGVSPERCVAPPLPSDAHALTVVDVGMW